ncbi:hypothetical protein MRX96_003855 [Rhipicephalus microplus]
MILGEALTIRCAYEMACCRSETTRRQHVIMLCLHKIAVREKELSTYAERQVLEVQDTCSSREAGVQTSSDAELHLHLFEKRLAGGNKNLFEQTATMNQHFGTYSIPNKKKQYGLEALDVCTALTCSEMQ